MRLIVACLLVVGLCLVWCVLWLGGGIDLVRLCVWLICVVVCCLFYFLLFAVLVLVLVCCCCCLFVLV